MIAGGSGITPMIPIIRNILSDENDSDFELDDETAEEYVEEEETDNEEEYEESDEYVENSNDESEEEETENESMIVSNAFLAASIGPFPLPVSLYSLEVQSVRRQILV